jgi:hypothetical protein
VARADEVLGRGRARWYNAAEETQYLMKSNAFLSFLRGMIAPPSVAIIVATALLAEFVNAGWLVPGLIVFVIAAYVQGPARAARAQRAEELGLDMQDGPPGLKRWNVRLNEALQRLEGDLGALNRGRMRFLKPVAEEVAALGGDIRRLLRQAYALHRYLNQTNTVAIRARAAHLDAQIATTEDPYSKQQLVEAAAALRRQLENCEQIRTLIGRTEATLENMLASLESIGSSVVKLGAGELSDENAARQESLQRLSSARGTVASLEEVLKHVELA